MKKHEDVRSVFVRRAYSYQHKGYFWWARITWDSGNWVRTEFKNLADLITWISEALEQGDPRKFRR